MERDSGKIKNTSNIKQILKRNKKMKVQCLPVWNALNVHSVCPLY